MQIMMPTGRVALRIRKLYAYKLLGMWYMLDPQKLSWLLQDYIKVVKEGKDSFQNKRPHNLLDLGKPQKEGF